MICIISIHLYICIDTILMLRKFYITTSIAYVNSKPHIGHALESVQADVLARYYRQSGYDVFFLTGTDEHGSKIQRAAEAVRKTPQEFVDELSEKFKGLKAALNLSWDNFIRTSDQKKHWPVAQEIWNKLFDAGDLFKKKYGGYYCVGCESFKTGKDIIDGKCAIHKKELEFIEDENWFFKLSKYTKEIESRILNNELRIVPESRKNETLSLLKGGLEDVSFSRSKKHLEWGIPVPNDDAQVMYVWADALTNYISGYGLNAKVSPDHPLNDLGRLKEWKKHPADVHIIGKDISRFHVAIWPAMLISCKLPLPKTIFIHGFITTNGEKMSKSLGNIIDPYELVKKYSSTTLATSGSPYSTDSFDKAQDKSGQASLSRAGTDAVRYYLLRGISSAEDGDFSYKKFEERYNGDLANGLGNFAARILALAERDANLQIHPNDANIDKVVDQKIKETKNLVQQKIGEFKLNEALEAIWELIHFGDQYLNEKKPWDKQVASEQRQIIIFNLIVILDNIAAFLLPFLPETAQEITDCIQWTSKDKVKITKGKTLFPRLPVTEKNQINN